MASNNAKFLTQINQFVTVTDASMLLVKKEVARQLFKKVIQRTPIWKLEENPGGTKGNWRASNGRPLTGEVERTDPSGEITIAAMEAVVDRAMEGKSVYLSNSSPHIEVLEDGKYPIGGLGTYSAETGSYEKRSTGGWSNQLLSFGPSGMVKVTLSEFEDIVAQATRKYKVTIR